MDFSANTFLNESINKRKTQNTYRQLKTTDNLIDFCSNDYLGFANSQTLKNNIQKEFESLEKTNNGSGGSRLLSGNSTYIETLEKKIANFHNAEKGLIFNSGYDANTGLFSSVIRNYHTVIYDELIHASIHDGINLSKANKIAFKHNNTSHLEDILRNTNGIVYVAIESIYSMDGECANLTEITNLCERYNANLIVDEAHATGVTPNLGKGKIQELGLESKIFARVHTFGKALGCHGAIVLGSNLLRNFLINYSRSFIYTTSLPLHSLVTINQSYSYLLNNTKEISNLSELISYFKIKTSKQSTPNSKENNSPIQSILIPGNELVKKTASNIQKAGFDVRAIVSPTVAIGKERIRICLHAFNTKEQIDKLCTLLNH